jgi:cytochrome b subunit of formate dehydrogenase
VQWGEGEEGSWSVGRCRYSCAVLNVCVGCIVVFLIHIYMSVWIALG